jgi:ferric-dicitrate binding protein FerR (iron transport regulator)
MNHEENDAVAALIRAAGKRPTVDPQSMIRVRAAVEDEWRATIRRRRFTRAGGALAALAAGVGGVVWLLPHSVPPPPAVPLAVVARVESVRGSAGITAGQELRAGAELRLASDATASLRWNGATLRLDGRTRLRLDGAKLATLHGGAVYYADERAGNGVTLRTPFGEVRDIGTRFEVRLRDDALRVRVRDGTVAVRGTVAKAGAEIVATRTAIAQHRIPVTGDEWSWIERAAPPLLLEGKTLAEVLRDVAREKGLTLEWSDAHARDVRLHGDVPLTAGEALEAATAAAGVTYRIDGGRLIIGRRS